MYMVSRLDYKRQETFMPFQRTDIFFLTWIRQLNVGFLCECFGGKRLQKNAGAPAGCVEAFL